jgi:hypothetical protein
MIISVDKAKTLVDFKGWTDEKILMKLKAVEQVIRAYTNNNFQNRSVRAAGEVFAEGINCSVPGLKVDDTVQITESKYNNGLYTVLEILDEGIILDAELINESSALVTKVEYPADVVDCCLNLLDWEINHRGKVGIQSETLSRHSVTYFNQDSANQVMGYPASLLGCLKAYRKCRC